MDIAVNVEAKNRCPSVTAKNLRLPQHSSTWESTHSSSLQQQCCRHVLTPQPTATAATAHSYNRHLYCHTVRLNHSLSLSVAALAAAAAAAG
eukprot:11475-Heterococcus_DN1.PRE.2